MCDDGGFEPLPPRCLLLLVNVFSRGIAGMPPVSWCSGNDGYYIMFLFRIYLYHVKFNRDVFFLYSTVRERYEFEIARPPLRDHFTNSHRRSISFSPPPASSSINGRLAHSHVQRFDGRRGICYATATRSFQQSTAGATATHTARCDADRLLHPSRTCPLCNRQQQQQQRSNAVQQHDVIVVVVVVAERIDWHENQLQRSWRQ